MPAPPPPPAGLVVSSAGDGGFMVPGEDSAAARHYGAKPVFLVFNNGMYGTIRAHQERHHSGRYIAVDLTNPDFAALAVSYGAYGETVSRTEEFGPALDRAIRSGRPAVLDLRMDPDVISTTTTLTRMREAAQARGQGG